MILRQEKHSVFVSEEGATVQQWQHGGTHIFYPQQIVQVGAALKLRGGMHACMPNFGSPKADIWGLPQHGTLRRRRDPGIVACDPDYHRATFFNKGEDFKQFPFDWGCAVEITATATGFTHNMEIFLLPVGERRGKKQVMPLCAGIHPYFKTPHGSRAFIGPVKYPVDTPSVESSVIQAPTQPIEIRLKGIGRVIMRLGGYRNLVLWTDHKDYFCIEPVMGVPQEFATDRGIYVAENREKSVKLTCEFSFD